MGYKQNAVNIIWIPALIGNSYPIIIKFSLSYMSSEVRK